MMYYLLLEIWGALNALEDLPIGDTQCMVIGNQTTTNKT